MNINCYIINLKKCPNKKENMIKRLNKYSDIKYNIYEAIDGQLINNEYLKNNNISICEKWKDPYYNRKITLGEIGCTLSHLNIYNKCINDEYDITLILEDDAILIDNFLNKLKDIINDLEYIHDWDILYLGRKKLNNIIEKCIHNNIYESSYSYWTIGYLINKKCCNKIINNNNLKNNIIPIDEYISIIGRVSNLKEYYNIFDEEIKLLTLKDNIVFPEDTAFKNSDTEISTFLKPLTSNNKLNIITVATDDNELLERFKKSCDIYNLKYKILGLNEKWTGGNMKKGLGGGMKINLLKNEIINYNDNDIILFTDSYDVIFLAYEDEILLKFKKFNCDLLFSAETVCWPVKNMNIYFNSDSIYKYLNSGGFIGYAKTIKNILKKKCEDTDDDQLYYQKIYINNNNNIKLDNYCDIFQTSHPNILDKIKIKNNRIINNIYNTNPCHFHGNGNDKIKVNFNNICNYLLYEWNNIYNYTGYKIPINNYYIIYIYIEIKIYNLSFLNNLKNLNYPKKNIILHLNCFKNKIDYKLDNLEYNKIIITHEKYNISKTNALNNCIKYKCDYYLNYDYNCYIENLDIIQDLISYNKNIIGPLLLLKKSLYSNFWGDIDDNGWYSRSFNYLDIINNNNIGCWNIPYISTFYIIKSSILNKINNYYISNYNTKKDEDVIFCENLRYNNNFIYITNEKYYGYIINENSIKENINIDNITIYDYKNNKELWKNKYLLKNFGKNINEPVIDVLQLPIFNNLFCEELINICEKYNNWSNAKHIDSRIGYENLPTNDIHLTQLNLENIWEEFILDEIAPIVSNHWGQFKTKNINISFVIKYEHNKFYKLEPHHDSSSYTLNICLNDEFEGGEINFISKKKFLNHIKGYGIIHPGKITHYHEGLPVIKGTKYVFVSFIN